MQTDFQGGRELQVIMDEMQSKSMYYKVKMHAQVVKAI